MRLKDQVAIVTGGAQGIGAAISAAFAEEGAVPIIADTNMEAARLTAQELDTVAIETDVADPASVGDLIDKVIAKHGRIDTLINNAGSRIIKGVLEHTTADWDRMIQVNLTGPFHCIQATVPFMIRQGGGRIINLASIASFVGRPNRCAYVAAKTGLLGLTRAVAADLAGTNITVNAIAPGMIASPFNQSFSEDGEKGPAWARENLLGRWGKPEDISGAAVFLASKDSSFITGAEIKVDGGWLGARARPGEDPKFG